MEYKSQSNTNQEAPIIVKTMKRPRKAGSVSMLSGIRAIVLALCLLEMTLVGVRGQTNGSHRELTGGISSGGQQGATYVDPATGQTVVAPSATIAIPPRPAPQAFTLADDNCGQWARAPDQTDGLVYDAQLTYAYDQTRGDVAVWTQTSTLKLPVVCLQCQVQYAAGTAAAATDPPTAYTYAQYLAAATTASTARAYLAYMGHGAWAGSVLCMSETVAGSGTYAAPAYFQQRIAQANTANALTEALQQQTFTPATRSQQTWSQSVLNPPLDFTAQPFNSTFMASQYSNAYDFKRLEAAAAARFNYTKMTAPTAGYSNYPKFAIGFLPVAMQYDTWQATYSVATDTNKALPTMTEHCELLSRADFVTTWTPLVTAKALAGMLTIIDKGWGCTSCRAFVYPTAAELAAGTPLVVNPPFAFLDIIGYDSTPSAHTFRQEGIYITRRCGTVNALAIGSGKVAGTRLFNQFVTNAAADAPVSCDVKIPNCALCSSNATAAARTARRWGAAGANAACPSAAGDAVGAVTQACGGATAATDCGGGLTEIECSYFVGDPYAADTVIKAASWGDMLTCPSGSAITGACTSAGTAACDGASSATITCTTGIKTTTDCNWRTQRNFTDDRATCDAGYVATARGASGNKIGVRGVPYRNDWYATVIKCCKITNSISVATADATPASTCSMCVDGYTLLNVTQPNNTVQEICVPEFCPQGQRMVTNFNGISYCVPCTITNCGTCQNITAKVQNGTTTTEATTTTAATSTPTYATSAFEVCGACFPPYVLNAFKTACISFQVWASQERATANAACATSDNTSGCVVNTAPTAVPTTRVVSYVIDPRPTDNENPNVYDVAYLTAMQTAEEAGTLYYIQQALNLINTLAANESHAEVNATIWLTKGDHFFFNCDQQVATTYTATGDAGATVNELTGVYSTDLSDRPPLQHNYLCAHKSMKFFYPKTDNVNLVIKTVLCNDAASAQAVAEPSAYESKCATVATGRDPWAAVDEATDERPVVHVNGPNFYFNVTKSLVVENVIFDGINQFAYMNLTQAVASDGTRTPSDADFVAAAPFSVPYMPKKLCTLLSSSSGITVAAGSTPLLSLMASQQSTTADKGYGVVPLVTTLQTNQVDDEPYLIDSAWSTDTKALTKAYEQRCAYRGSQHNLFTSGTVDEFNNLKKGVHPKFYPESADFDSEAFKAKILASQGQDLIDYSAVSFNAFTTDASASDVADPSYGMATNAKRRSALFNLYAFTAEDSYQKQITASGAASMAVGTGEVPTSGLSQGVYLSRQSEYTIPTLALDNVDVRNFLYDQQALIYVEKDNYIVKPDAHNASSQHIRHYGDYTAAANVTITGSRFTDCRFMRGLLYMPPLHTFPNKGPDGTVFRSQDNQVAGYWPLIQQQKRQAAAQQQVYIERSTFLNLNYGYVTHSLASLNKTRNEYAASRGLILSITDFNGNVEVHTSNFGSNLVFIPSAIYANAQKFNTTFLNPVLSDFEYKFNSTVSAQDQDGSYLQMTRYPSPNKTSVLDTILGGHNIYFMNYIDPPSQYRTLRDDYETISPIYLEDVRGQHVIFKDNTFESNIGIHGGAIHINLEDKQEGLAQINDFTPYLWFNNNTFSKNMAYFEGNAIYVRGGQRTKVPSDWVAKTGYINMEMVGCQFTLNYGLNVGFGAAISINGMQDKVFQDELVAQNSTLAPIRSKSLNSNDSDCQNEVRCWKREQKYGHFYDPARKQYTQKSLNATAKLIKITTSTFTQNFAGQRASAINVIGVYGSDVEVSNATFTKNTGAFSLFEAQQRLPFLTLLTMGKYKLNYIAFDQASYNFFEQQTGSCWDEFASVGVDACIYQAYDTAAAAANSPKNPLEGGVLHIQHPRMKGAVFFESNRNAAIYFSSFTSNEPGPILNPVPVVGLGARLSAASSGIPDFGNVQRASSVFVSDYATQALISGCTFSGNQLAFMLPHIRKVNPALVAYFGAPYFTKATSPTINVYMYPTRSSRAVVTVNNCTFAHQRNHEVLGFTSSNDSYTSVQYYGSLINVVSNNVLSQLKVKSSIFYDQIMIGAASSLINNYASGTVDASDNVFFEIGYLAGSNTPAAMPSAALPKDEDGNPARNFTFHDPSAVPTYQRVGIFDVGSKGLPPGALNTFQGNQFSKVYARDAGIYSFHSHSGSDTRYSLIGNTYQHVFAMGAAILSCDQQQTSKPAETSTWTAYLEAHPNDIGLIKIKGDVITQSQAAKQGLSDRTSALIVASSVERQLSLFITDSYIYGNQYNHVAAHNVQLLMRNTTVSLAAGPQFTKDYPDLADTLTSQAKATAARLGPPQAALFVAPSLAVIQSQNKTGWQDVTAEELAKANNIGRSNLPNDNIKSANYNATRAAHFNPKSGMLLAPTEAQLAAEPAPAAKIAIARPTLFSLITATAQWPSKAFAAKQNYTFVNETSFGQEKGLLKIFEGFVIGPAAAKAQSIGREMDGTVFDSTQLVNCTFRDIYATGKYAMVFDLYLFTNVYARASEFYNVQTLTFWKNQYSVLYLEASTVSYQGLHLLEELPEARKASLTDHLFPSTRRSGEQTPEQKYSALMTPYALQQAKTKTPLPTGGAALGAIPNGFLSGSQGWTVSVNCTFRNSLSVRGLLQGQGGSGSGENMWFISAKVQRLAAVDQAAFLFVIENAQGTIELFDSVVEDCLSASSLISLTFGHMTIRGTSFLGNYAQLGANGISMLYSAATITNSTIDNQRNNVKVTAAEMQAIDAGFISMNYQSQVRFDNVTVKGLLADSSSVISAHGRSSVAVAGSTFWNNTATSGACIDARAPPSFTLSGSTVMKSDGIVVKGMAAGASFNISGSQIFPAKAIPGITIVNSTGTVTNTTFASNATLGNADQTNSGLLISGSTSDVTIDGCSFNNLTSKIGAGVQVTSAAKISIVNSTFFNNTAPIGAGVALTSVNISVLTTNNFTSNRAVKIDGQPIDMVADQNSLRAGGLWLDCERTDETTTKTKNPYRCACNLIGSATAKNTFANNYAAIQGGAISARSAGCTITDDGVVMTNNTAGVIKGAVSSYAKTVSFNLTNNASVGGSQVVKYNASDSRLNAAAKAQMFAINAKLGTTDYLEIPSGQKMNISISLRGADGELMANENTARAIIRLRTLAELTPGKVTAKRRLQQPATGQDNDMARNLQANKKKDGDKKEEAKEEKKEEKDKDKDAPTPAPATTSTTTTKPAPFKNRIQHNSATCVNGTFSFTDLTITVAPGDIQLIEFEFEGLEDNGIQREFITKPYVQAVYSRQCIAGEEQTARGTCERCGYGFYSMAVPDGESSCKLCENNAVCLGGNVMYPMQGHYKKVPYGAAVFECYNQNACLAGSADALTGTCAAGYQGFMCGSCVNMFYKNAQSQCSSCPSSNTAMIQAALRLLWLTVLIYGISKLNLRVTQQSYNKAGGHQYDAFLSNLKEIINHCVVLAAISTIKFDWSATLQRILDAQGYIMLLLSRLVAFQCLVAGTGDVEPGDVTPFFRNLLATVVSPFVLIAWIVLVMFLVSLTKGSFNAVRDQLVCAIVVILWIVHPDICHAVFASFSCIDDGTGQSRLFHDLEVVCWEGQHKNFVTFVSIPALIFWVLGVPGYFMHSLRKNQHLHQKIEAKRNLTKLELHEIDTYQNRWGVLTSGLQADYYYWEVLVMVRKMLIIACIECLAAVAGEVQILATMLVVVVSAMSVLYSKPFGCSTENAFNAFSQAVHLIWLYDGLYYLVGNGQAWMWAPDSGVNWIFIVFISVPSFGFFLLWLAKVKDHILIIVYKANRTAWKVLTCGTVNAEEFQRKYIDTFHDHGDKKDMDFDELPDATHGEASRRGSVDGRKSRDPLYLQDGARGGELDYERSQNVSHAGLHEGDETAIQQKLKEMINLQLQQQVRMNETHKDLSQLKQSVRSSGRYPGGAYGDPGNYASGAYGGGPLPDGANPVQEEIRRLQAFLDQAEGQQPMPGGGDGVYGRPQAPISNQNQDYEMVRMGMPPMTRSQAPVRLDANGGFFGAGQGQLGSMDQKLGYEDRMYQAAAARPGGAGLRQSQQAPSRRAQPLEYGDGAGLGASAGGGFRGAESSQGAGAGLQNRPGAMKKFKSQPRVQAPLRLQVEDEAGQPRPDGLDIDPRASRGSRESRQSRKGEAAHVEAKAQPDQFAGPASQPQQHENPFARAQAGRDAGPPDGSELSLDGAFDPVNPSRQLGADQMKDEQARPQPPADDFQDIEAGAERYVASQVSQQKLVPALTPDGNDGAESETSSIRKGRASGVLDRIKSKQQQSRKGQSAAQRLQAAAAKSKSNLK